MNGGRVLSHVAMERDLVQEQYPLRPLGVEQNVMVKQPKRSHAKSVNVQVGIVLLTSICTTINVIIIVTFIALQLLSKSLIDNKIQIL